MSLHEVLETLEYCLIIGVISTNVCALISFLSRCTINTKISANWLLLHKLLCDLSIVFLSLPFAFPDQIGHFLRKIYITPHGIAVFTEYVNVGALCISVIERYISIEDPYYYRTKLTKCTLLLAVVLVWVISIVISIVVNRILPEYNMILAFYCMILPIATCLLAMLIITKCRSKMIYQQERVIQETTGVQSNRDMSEKENARYITILLVMVILYLATLLPFLICIVSFSFAPKVVVSMRIYGYVLPITSAIHSSCSIINPLLTMVVFLRCCWRILLYTIDITWQ